LSSGPAIWDNLGGEVFSVSTICRVCGHSGPRQVYQLSEKMFGLGDEFDYFSCGGCTCLQIATFPANLARYYPPNYYSFLFGSVPQSSVKASLASQRDRACLTSDRRPLGRLLGKIMPAQLAIQALGRLSLRPDVRILDVGCGRGTLLSILYRSGFRNLSGIDPFLEKDLEVLPGLWVRKQGIDSVDDTFDIIMLHHVLEHVEDPVGVLRACRKIMASAGRILVRIPTIESVAWERYESNWVQLDAPRHLHLFSRTSLNLCAQEAGLEILAQWCDSTSFQFWGSELYQQGIPLMDEYGEVVQPRRFFSRNQMKAFALEAKRLNSLDRGDQIVVIMVARIRSYPEAPRWVQSPQDASAAGIRGGSFSATPLHHSG
jgi:2-polyprenyl-3-methyl-5-hydroxy-6-metoxy-1,4-benzoquinol methylase